MRETRLRSLVFGHPGGTPVPPPLALLARYSLAFRALLLTAAALGITAMSATQLPAAPAPRPPAAANEWWMGIYLGDHKLGYTHITTDPVGEGPQSDLRVRASTWMRAAVLGASLEQRVDADELRAHDKRPRSLSVRIGSAGRWVDVKARFLADRVEIERHAGGEILRKSLPVPEGANLVADMDTALLRRSVNPGDTWRYTYLNVLSLTLEEATTTVLRRETIQVDGRTYDTVVARSTSTTVDATSWLLDDGSPVKVVSSPGFTMLRESREKALSDLEERPYEPSRDLATQTAVRTQGTLDAPRQVKSLRLRVSGIPERRFVLADGRQAAIVESDTPEGLVVTYTVNADERVAATLTAAERAALLAPRPYLETDHPEIQARARAVVAGAPDDAARVQALWRWVHETMRVQGDIGVPRGAIDVLREPVGVCRDYAALYTALARAAGIPTRVCAGILYFKDRFYYHAWAESHVAGRWVAVDATEPAGFVDATHIKFAQGDMDAMFGAVKIVGRLQAQILEAH